MAPMHDDNQYDDDRYGGTRHDECAAAVELIDRYLDSELPEDLQRSVAAHTAGCAACARVLAGRSAIRAGLQRAVGREQVPEDLQARVTGRLAAGTREQIISMIPWSRWSLAAAAAVIVLIGGWGLMRLVDGSGQGPGTRVPDVAARQNGPPGGQPGGMPGGTPGGTPGAVPAGEIVRVAMRDHVECALAYRPGHAPMTSAMMAERLGPEYAGLITLLRDHLNGFKVVSAHRCARGGRSFIHIILADGSRVVSLAITRRNGDSLSRCHDISLSTVGGIPLFLARMGDPRRFSITGFQTCRHMAFVVSDADDPTTMPIAQTLAPGVHAFLEGLDARANAKGRVVGVSNGSRGRCTTVIRICCERFERSAAFTISL